MGKFFFITLLFCYGECSNLEHELLFLYDCRIYGFFVLSKSFKIIIPSAIFVFGFFIYSYFYKYWTK